MFQTASGSAKEFDICDDITSGMAEGECRAHQERIVAVQRQARRQAAVAGLADEELRKLDSAATAFFEANRFLPQGERLQARIQPSTRSTSGSSPRDDSSSAPSSRMVFARRRVFGFHIAMRGSLSEQRCVQMSRPKRGRPG
jgi:hypothetical protein